jgi:hypothetical protein
LIPRVAFDVVIVVFDFVEAAKFSAVDHVNVEDKLVQLLSDFVIVKFTEDCR